VGAHLYKDRNRGMILDAGVVVAVWRPSRLRGGTYHALTVAHELHRPVIHINPDTMAPARRLLPGELPRMLRLAHAA
jgi:hypothetical protein